MQNKVKDQGQEDRKHVVFYALSMAIGTFSSRVLGLVRDILFAAFFSRTITDAWTAAFRLPNFFRRLLGEGALAVGFIPIFVELRAQDPSGEKSRRLVFGFYSVLFIFLSVFMALGFIYSDSLLSLLLDSNYVNDPIRFSIASRMFKIMVGFIFLMSHYAYYVAILNALGEYSWPAMAPVFFNIAMIASTLIPQVWFTVVGDSLAWGVIVGGLFQVLVLIPLLQKKGLLPHPFSFKHFLNFNFIRKSILSRDVQNVFRNMLPGILGTGLLQITTLINLRFASSLGEGPISYIYWADRLLELPISLVAVSLGSALLLTLSKMWADGHKKNMIEASDYYLRLNFFISTPAAVGLWVLSRPIVEVLFKRGQFIETDLAATAAVVSIYSFILLSSSAVRVIVPAYYAVKNNWIPSAVAVFCLITHILIAPLLMNKYGLNGLVSSSVVSSSLNFILLVIFIHKFVGSYKWFHFLLNFLKMLFSGLLMGIIVAFTHSKLFEIVPQTFVGRIFSLSITIIFGVYIYGVASWILKIEELRTVIGIVSKKLKIRI